MKILVDMNLSPLWVPFFLTHAVEAIHWATVGEAVAPDSAILDYAATHGYVVFTNDLDFGMLLTVRKAGRPSVIQVRSQDVLSSAIGPAVLQSIRSVQHHLESGALVTVEPARARIRLLPI